MIDIMAMGLIFNLVVGNLILFKALLLGEKWLMDRLGDIVQILVAMAGIILAVLAWTESA